MLDSTIKQQLKTYLQHLQQPITLTAYLDDVATPTGKSLELVNLVNDIAALSDLISVNLQGPAAGERVPSMRINNPETGSDIAFAGLPMGHEFNSLVLALLQSGGHDTRLTEQQSQQIAELPADYHFEIFISLSCQNCPEVVQALNTMAVVNPRIKSVMIDGALFQQEVDDRQVMAVPSVFLNGQPFAQGRINLEQILTKLDSKAEQRAVEAINDKAEFDMLVVGAGPAGAAAAIYAARKGIRTGLVVDRFGGQVQDTMAIENFISVKSTEGPKLAASLEQHVLDYEVDVMTNQLAKNLKSAADGGFDVELKSGASLRSKTVLLATGASWREMNVPGEAEYKGRGVAYCPHCDGPLFKGKKVAVIGGGNSGIEAAIDLAGIVEHVTVLEFADTLRADEVLVSKAKSLPNVEILTQALTTEVIGDGSKVTGLRYQDRANGQQHELDLAGIFVQIGLVPNTAWLQDSGVDLNERGEIVTDSHGQTTVPGVFAAGDVTDVPYKQIIIAMGSGATASLGAFDYLMRLPVSAQDAA